MTDRLGISYFNSILFTFLFCLLLIPVAHADDDDYPVMGPMMGGMGMGPMGMGHMMRGMGMGMGQMMGGMGMGMGPMIGGMVMQNTFYLLDLSDKQRSAMRDIQRKNRNAVLELQDKIVELSDQLYDLYKEDRPDAKKIGEVYAQIFNIKRQIIELSVVARNEQYDLLSKEQKQKLQELQSGWMGMFGGNARHRGMMQNMMH